MASGPPVQDRISIEAAADPASPFAALIPGCRRARDTTQMNEAADLCALPVQPAAPPHPWLDMLSRLTLPGVILPSARVTAHGQDWIACRRPTGQPIRLEAHTDEHALIASVLRPAASILRRMAAQQLTHRAIQPGNLFAGDTGIELGPFWLTPPTFLQPCVFETPAAASCVRQARGPGTIADDIYALGVTLLALYLGEIPMQGVPDAEIIERKLWLGSYAALTEGRRIPIALGEIIAAMLADQASQRPTPDRLCRPGGVSGAAIGSRKRVNAAIPLMLAGREIWNTPQLAFIAGEQPEMVSRALIDGLIDAWLRRGLNEVVLAERIEAVVRPGGHRLAGRDRWTDEAARTLLLSRVAPLLDPDGPILWERIRLMPDGIGGLLASSGHDPLVAPEMVSRLLASEALVSRAADMPASGAREIAVAAARRCMGAARSQGALLKLMYELNPTMACASPLLLRHPVASLSGVLPALDNVCAGGGSGAGAFALDHHLVSFITIRRAAAGLKQVRASQGRSDLRLLASLADESGMNGLTDLARALSLPVKASMAEWPGASRRAARQIRIEQAVAAGDLPALVAVAEDPQGLAHDKASSEAAHARIRALRLLDDGLAGAADERRRIALRFGREGIVVVGAAACAIALLLQVIS